MAISKEQRGFIVELGTRIAERRKDQGLTQAQLADALGVAQQTITACEVGRRRVPVTSLAQPAQTLGWQMIDTVLQQQASR